MIAVASAPGKLWTEEALQALPDDGYTHEVVNGQLVMSPKDNWCHGDICAELLAALRTFANQHRLGAVWDSSTGFWMKNQNCRAPDISFVGKERLKGFRRMEGRFFRGAPDLAVEILSPSNTRAEIDERLEDFFASGTLLAWIIHPEGQFVEVYRPHAEREVIGPEGSLDGELLLPGFRFPVSVLFEEWNWE